MRRGLGAIVLGLAAVFAARAADDDIARPLAVLAAVDREGKTNEDAGPAWKSLVSQGGAALMPTLETIDDAKPTTANWLRTAVDAIAEAEAKAGQPLPAAKLEAFATDAKRAPTARRLAFELLVKQDPAAKSRLLPGFLNDRNADLRRDAIAAELAKLDASAGPSTKAALEKLFTFTRDKDQVEAIAAKLDKEYQSKVSVPEHFAFVTHWHLVGPFDSERGKALTVSYPPETSPDLSAKLKGKDGAEVAWKPQATADKYGIVNLNEVVGKHKNACEYAFAVVTAEKSTPCEIRVGSPNAVAIFLNGKKLFEREEYHHGDALDYHVGKGVLEAGENKLVVKVCQNNQTETWALRWQFQARICDATGTPLPGVTQLVNGSKTKLGTKTEEKK